MFSLFSSQNIQTANIQQTNSAANKTVEAPENKTQEKKERHEYREYNTITKGLGFMLVKNEGDLEKENNGIDTNTGTIIKRIK